MGIVTAGLQRATPGARKEATLFCGNWGLTGRTCGILLPAAEGDRLRPRLRGVEGVDKTERSAENTSADGEAGAVGLPLVLEVAVGCAAVVRNFLFVLGHVD